MKFKFLVVYEIKHHFVPHYCTKTVSERNYSDDLNASSLVCNNLIKTSRFLPISGFRTVFGCICRPMKYREKKGNGTTLLG